jgi:hypothetical protein
VVAVLKGTGIHVPPSREVHTGVVVAPSEVSEPTAMYPSRQRSIDRTRRSGSAAARRHQRIALHVAVAGGGIPNTSVVATAGVGAAGVGTAVPVAAGEAEMLAAPVPRDAGGSEADAAGLPHGLARAIPMNATIRTRTSPAVLRPRVSSVTRWLSGVVGSCIVVP